MKIIINTIVPYAELDSSVTAEVMMPTQVLAINAPRILPTPPTMLTIIDRKSVV